MTTVSQEAQKNFDDLTAVQSDLKVVHENELVPLTDRHASFKRDLSITCMLLDKSYLVSFLSLRRRFSSNCTVQC